MLVFGEIMRSGNPQSYEEVAFACVSGAPVFFNRTVNLLGRPFAFFPVPPATGRVLQERRRRFMASNSRNRRPGAG